MQLALVERDSEGIYRIKVDLTSEGIPLVFALLMWDVLRERAGSLKKLTFEDVVRAVRYALDNLKQRSVEVE